MAQSVSCVATRPSSKRLFIPGVLSPRNYMLTLVAPARYLTELGFVDVPIEEDERACLVSASGSTLERLTLNCISQLTNAGLGAALNAVRASLTYLYIKSNAFARDQGEEHGLDVIVTCIVRLVNLEISLQNGS